MMKQTPLGLELSLSFSIWIKSLLDSENVAYSATKYDYLQFETELLIVRYFYQISKSELSNQECKNVINIWEDQWYKYPKIVVSRLNYKLGFAKSLPARVCKLRRINAELANDFLVENHLLGSTNSKLKYGLFIPKAYFRLLGDVFYDDQQAIDEILLAVMTFNNPKKFYDKDEPYYSYEMVRFAQKNDIFVNGGFSKMLKYFIKDKSPGNIMTYIDSDWSDGATYEKFGFEFIENLEPMFFDKNIDGGRTLNASLCGEIKNAGSKKFILRNFDRYKK